MHVYFTEVAPGNIRDAWGFVRPALETMERGDGWLVEDVYMTLKSNGATLYLIHDRETGRNAGFFILRLLADFDGLRLHIWCLHAVDNGFDVMTAFSDDLDRMARNAGARRLTFSSPRNGWTKAAPQYGFRLREVMYEREVTS